MGSRTPAKSRKGILKEPATPSKKIADLICRKEEGEDVVKCIKSMKKEIEATPFSIGQRGGDYKCSFHYVVTSSDGSSLCSHHPCA